MVGERRRDARGFRVISRMEWFRSQRASRVGLKYDARWIHRSRVGDGDDVEATTTSRRRRHRGDVTSRRQRRMQLTSAPRSVHLQTHGASRRRLRARLSKRVAASANEEPSSESRFVLLKHVNARRGATALDTMKVKDIMTRPVPAFRPSKRVWQPGYGSDETCLASFSRGYEVVDDKLVSKVGVICKTDYEFKVVEGYMMQDAMGNVMRNDDGHQILRGAAEVGRFSKLPVIDYDGRLVGTLHPWCFDALVRTPARTRSWVRKTPEMPVSKLMSTPVKCVHADTPVSIAVMYMLYAQRGVKSRDKHRDMPVIDDQKRFVGMLQDSKVDETFEQFFTDKVLDERVPMSDPDYYIRVLRNLGVSEMVASTNFDVNEMNEILRVAKVPIQFVDSAPGGAAPNREELEFSDAVVFVNEEPSEIFQDLDDEDDEDEDEEWPPLEWLNLNYDLFHSN